MIVMKNPYIIEKAGHLAIMATDNIWIWVLYHFNCKMQMKKHKNYSFN